MHRRIIPVALPGDTVPTATFAGELRSPVLRKPVKIGVPKAPSSRELDRPKAETEGVNAPAYHPVRPSRQHRADGNVFRTPREGRPYGQTDKPHTVGRGLAPAEML